MASSKRPPSKRPGGAPERGIAQPRPAAAQVDEGSTRHDPALHSVTRVAGTSEIMEMTASTSAELSFEVLAGLADDQSGVRRRPEGFPDECERARLIGAISRLVREPLVPESTRTAGLTLIGWLARRMPGETPHTLGVAEARADARPFGTKR